jgi:hypothetical protein
MPNIKTVPNQKIVTVNKEPCSKCNHYAMINISAMEGASRDLRAGSFVLWCYFAKNQGGYEFALSNTAALESMGIKRDAYNNAVKELMEKGYLVNTCGNNYQFNEKPQAKDRPQAEILQPAAEEPVKGKTHNAPMGNTVKALLEKASRNNT